MKSIALVAAALIAAGTASAQEVSPGKAQLAALLGVDAAAYSLAELNTIYEARRDSDRKAETFYLSHKNREQRGGVGEVSSGKAQLAAILGVDPAEYTLADLNSIRQARVDRDWKAEAFYLSHQNREQRGGVGEVSPGKAQLAAILGVNPAEFTLAELAALEAARNVADN